MPFSFLIFNISNLLGQTELVKETGFSLNSKVWESIRLKSADYDWHIGERAVGSLSGTDDTDLRAIIVVDEVINKSTLRSINTWKDENRMNCVFDSELTGVGRMGRRRDQWCEKNSGLQDGTGEQAEEVFWLSVLGVLFLEIIADLEEMLRHAAPTLVMMFTKHWILLGRRA